MSKELDKVNEIHTRAIYKADGTTVIESGWFNLLIAYAKDALQRLEQIDNSNPSEALEKLDDISYLVLNEIDDLKNKELWKSYFDTIKQALLKAQEPKQYLKWEDLEFGKTSHKLKCKMNDSLYRIEWFIDEIGFKTVNIYRYFCKDYLEFATCLKDDKKQFFNDLHLEKVEE